jgi:hypothetical protein
MAANQSLLRVLDATFEVVFARFRRKLGDSNLQLAWRRASNTVSGYLVLPIAALVTVAVAVVHAVTGGGTHIDHRFSSQIIAIVMVLVTAILLDRRFRKFLDPVPVLVAHESAEDGRRLLWFRISTVGLFLAICAIGFSMHLAGSKLLGGL